MNTCLSRTPRMLATFLSALLCVLTIMDAQVNAQSSTQVPATPKTIRIATYNASLYGKMAGQIRERLSDGQDKHAANVARIVQTIRPDILLINEIDYDDEGTVPSLLNREFFAKPQGRLAAVKYPYVYAVPSNTGIGSGMDLNKNGKPDEPNDAWGFGVYPGQYAMAVFSRYPIESEKIRSFQRFLWKDLPGALRPTHPETKAPFYSDSTWAQMRLSSKNHVDVPIRINEFTIHVLACHPTPPVFDGPEDHNGCRNHDEIRFWTEYLKGDEAKTLVDDQGKHGGLPKNESFVIMGDLNSDTADGDSKRSAIIDLIANARVYDPKPTSKGAVEAATSKKAKQQKGDPALDTARFGGNMRVDYVLPSKTLLRKDAGVVWPEKSNKDYDMITTSDHRMVWVEVVIPQ